MLRAHKSRIARNHARPGRGCRSHWCGWGRGARTAGRYRAKVGGASGGAGRRVKAAGTLAGQVRRVARMREQPIRRVAAGVVRLHAESGAGPPCGPMEDADWRRARASISFKDHAARVTGRAGGDHDHVPESVAVARRKAARPARSAHAASIAVTPLLAWVGRRRRPVVVVLRPGRSVPRAGAHTPLALFLALATAATVFIIALGYNQVIELFPTGGGGTASRRRCSARSRRVGRRVAGRLRADRRDVARERRRRVLQPAAGQRAGVQAHDRDRADRADDGPTSAGCANRSWCCCRSSSAS